VRRQTEAVTANQLKHFADRFTKPQVLKGDIDVQLEDSIDFPGDQVAIDGMLRRRDFDQAVRQTLRVRPRYGNKEVRRPPLCLRAQATPSCRSR
jgi:hypothetical protein